MGHSIPLSGAAVTVLLHHLPNWCVVVKAREDDGRAASCVAAQAQLAERGFPCARPLTPVAGVGAHAVLITSLHLAAA